MVQAPLFVKVPLRMTLPLLTQAMPCCPHVSLAGVQAQCVQYAQELTRKPRFMCSPTALHYIVTLICSGHCKGAHNAPQSPHS
jgi:hypothetical protein